MGDDRADRRGAVEVGRLLDAHADGSRRVLGLDGTDTSDPRRRLEMIIRAEIDREEAERIAEQVSRAKRHALKCLSHQRNPADSTIREPAGTN